MLVSTVKARGTMGTCNQFVIGILLAFVIGLLLAKVPLWIINYAIIAIPVNAQSFLMAGCVESTPYLISVNCIEESRENLQSLQPNSNINKEFFGMIKG